MSSISVSSLSVLEFDENDSESEYIELESVTDMVMDGKDGLVDGDGQQKRYSHRA
jgi:hypothetical protein